MTESNSSRGAGGGTKSKQYGVVTTPESVEIIDCDPSKSYSSTLDIRNVGTVSHSLKFRLLPPTSSSSSSQPPTFNPFSLRLPDSMFLAPGMSLKISVETRVNCHCEDWSSCLQILNPADDTNVLCSVPLRVYRNRAHLMFPTPLSCGFSVIGLSRVLTHTLQNPSGSPGLFLLCDDATANRLKLLSGQSFDREFHRLYHSTETTDTTTERIFNVEPKRIEVERGVYTTEISVEFAPPVGREFTRYLRLVGDGRQDHVVELSGNGCVPSAQLYNPATSVNTTTSSSITTTTPSSPSSSSTGGGTAAAGMMNMNLSLIFDGAGDDESSNIKHLRVKNSVAVAMSYRWHLFPVPAHELSPFWDPKTTTTSTTTTSSSSTTAAATTRNEETMTMIPFRVEPECGVIGELEELSFEVKFASGSSGTFTAMAFLVMEGMPFCLPGDFLDSSSSSSIVPSFITSSSSSTTTSSATGNLVMFRVGMKGLSPAPRVTFNPSVVYIPDPLYTSSSSPLHHTITLINSSKFPCIYNYTALHKLSSITSTTNHHHQQQQLTTTSEDPFPEPNNEQQQDEKEEEEEEELMKTIKITIDPPCGPIPSKSSVTATLSIIQSPPPSTTREQKRLKKMTGMLRFELCSPLDSSVVLPNTSLDLPVVFTSARVFLSMTPSYLDFGLVQVGKQETRSLVISPGPDASFPLPWSLQVNPMLLDTTSIFSLSSSSGVIQSPSSSVTTVQLSFTPLRPLRQVFSLQLLSDSSSSSSSSSSVVESETHVKACSDYPTVVVDRCTADLGSVPAEQQKTFTLRLINLGGIHARFTWMEKDTPEYEAKFHPRDGLLDAFTSQEIRCMFRPKVSNLSVVSALLACTVQGMPTPIGIAVRCRVGGLTVNCTVLDVEGMEEQDCHIELPLLDDSGAAPTIKLPHVPILSSVTFRLELENNSSVDTSIRINVGIPSANPQSHQNQQQQGGGGGGNSSSGMRVTLNPSSSFILRRCGSRQFVSVTCMAELPGVYTESLVVEMDGPRAVIPLSLSSYGSPLSIQPSTLGLSLPSDDQSGGVMMSWGVICPGVVSRRLFRVVNNAPYDVGIRWRFETSAGGVAASPPFSASPSSLVVPSSSSPTDVVLSFFTTEIGVFRWRAIGDIRPIGRSFVSSFSSSSTSSSQQQQQQQQSMMMLPSLVVGLTAETIAPEFELVPDTRRLTFTLPAIDASFPAQQRRIEAKNTLPFALDFTAEINPPLLFSVSPASGSVPPGKSISLDLTLNPRALAMTVVAPSSCVSSSSVSSSLCGGGGGGDDNNSSSNGCVEDVDSMAALIFKFGQQQSQSSQHVQKVIVVAEVRHAKLYTVPSSGLDFGSVPIGECRTLELTVMNSSALFGSHWMVSSGSNITSTSAFSWTPSSGYSDSSSSSSSSSSTAAAAVASSVPSTPGGGVLGNKIKVSFCPREQKVYDCSIKIIPEKANPITVSLYGFGSYNERLF